MALISFPQEIAIVILEWEVEESTMELAKEKASLWRVKAVLNKDK